MKSQWVVLDTGGAIKKEDTCVLTVPGGVVIRCDSLEENGNGIASSIGMVFVRGSREVMDQWIEENKA